MRDDKTQQGDDSARTTEGLLALWVADMSMRRLSARTISERVRLVRHVEVRTGGADALDESQVREFLLDLAATRAASTQFNYHVIIRMWSHWLVDSGHRLDDPTAQLPKPRLPKMRPRPASTTHVEAVLRHGNLAPQTVMKVLLAGYQGMRCIEIARVRGEYVDLAAQKIRILGKGGTDVLSDLHPEVLNFATLHPDFFPRRGWWFPSPVHPDRHVRPSSVSQVLSFAFRRVGAPVTAHQLRHWTATELIRADVPTRVVQKIMRHSSIQTTEGYTAVADDSLAAAIRRLPLVHR